MRTGLECVASTATNLFLVLCVAGAAQAQIVRCDPVAGSFTVFLSEPLFTQAAFRSPDDCRFFMERLQFALDQGRNNKWIRSPNTPVRFVWCPGRKPALDGHEFDEKVIGDLYRGGVIVEMWGSLDAKQTSVGAPVASVQMNETFAQMNYLLVPIQKAAGRNELAPAALQRLEYKGQPAETEPDFVRLIAQPTDIDAFVAAAFGFKLLREENYELAHTNLCRANALLQGIESRSLTGKTKEDIKALRTFVLESAKKAITDALADTNYNAGGQLRQYEPNSPCAGEK